jgi:hypothetical protein
MFIFLFCLACHACDKSITVFMPPFSKKKQANGLNFAVFVAATGRTGAYVCLGCSTSRDLSFLNPFGGSWIGSGLSCTHRNEYLCESRLSYSYL